MAVLVLTRDDRGDGTVEVTLSQDGVRFTVIVPSTVDRDDTALNIYQIMADRMVRQVRALQDITRPGGVF